MSLLFDPQSDDAKLSVQDNIDLIEDRIHESLSFRSRVAPLPKNLVDHYGIPIYKLLRQVSAQPLRHKQPAPVYNGDGRLLTEKYRPSKFIDLVGSGKTHRSILRWVSQWRPVVFGGEALRTDSDRYPTDRLGRPMRKILLVHGPPGAGKTTAAHVVARQAGYEVLEVNASDARTSSVVREVVQMAVQSHRVVSKKPTCVILDEIEGASEHGFVRALVEMVAADSRYLAGKPRKNDKPLLRPIIAICNDPWSSSLQSLRPVAEIVSLPRQTPGQVSDRLEAIAALENLSFTFRELNAIVDECDGDLRACLNALQFGSAGAKDGHGVSAARQFGPSPMKLSEIDPGEAERALGQCFSTYPAARYVDDMLAKPCEVGEWLGLVDRRNMPDELVATAVHAFGILFHSSAAAPPPLGRIPQSFYEESRQVRGISQMLATRADRALRIPHDCLLTEVLPYASHISCTWARPVPQPEDRARMLSVASSLKSLGIRLKPEKVDGGAVVLRLEPPLELAVSFNDSAREKIASWKYASRTQLKDVYDSMLGERLLAGRNVDNADKTQAVSRAPDEPRKKRKVDFFGKEIQELPSQNESKVRKVWVQYMEGFSNAVRKPITWNELFPQTTM